MLFQRGVRTKNPYTKGDDAVVRDDRTVTLTLEDGEGYTVSSEARSAQVVVQDNDEVEFALSVDPAEIGEGESATVRVAITNGVTFADEQAITLGFGGSTATKGADYTVSPEALTLRGGRDFGAGHGEGLGRWRRGRRRDGRDHSQSRRGDGRDGSRRDQGCTEDSQDSESEPAGEGFSLAPKNSRPSGIWSDGETAWVADLDDARLYAYRRSDGERVTRTKDLATGPGPRWACGRTGRPCGWPIWAAACGRTSWQTGRARRGATSTLEANAAPAGVWSDGRDGLGVGVAGGHGARLSAARRRARSQPGHPGWRVATCCRSACGRTARRCGWRTGGSACTPTACPMAGGIRSGTSMQGAGDADPSGLWSGGGTLLSTSWGAAEVRAYRLPEVPARDAAPGKGGTGGLPARAASLPPIADPALRAAITAALGKAPGEAVSPEELVGLEALVARNGGIRDLAGLERAVGLKQLDLGFNLLSDLRPLAALPSLESLNLDGAAPDLQVLASLAGLKRLSVRNNGIEDLGALASLAGLTELDAGDNLIANLRPLSGLGRLEVLRADRNRIADLWPLASLARLEVLELGSNRIGDLQPLAGLARLRKLRLAGNGLAELHPLSSLEGLRDLGLAGNAVEQLRALSHLGGLRRLDLRGNPLGELRSLQALRSLAWVHVGGTRIEDLAPLNGLPGLTVAGRDDLQPPEAGGGAGRAGRD